MCVCVCGPCDLLWYQIEIWALNVFHYLVFCTRNLFAVYHLLNVRQMPSCQCGLLSILNKLIPISFTKLFAFISYSCICSHFYYVWQISHNSCSNLEKIDRTGGEMVVAMFWIIFLNLFRYFQKIMENALPNEDNSESDAAHLFHLFLEQSSVKCNVFLAHFNFNWRARVELNSKFGPKNFMRHKSVRPSQFEFFSHILSWSKKQNWA